VEYGIGSHILKNPGAVHAWQAISLLLGPLTIVLGIMAWFLLGTPREVFWLTAEDRRIALARTVDNQTGSDAKKRSEWKWNQVAEAFIDPQVCTWPFPIAMVGAELLYSYTLSRLISSSSAWGLLPHPTAESLVSVNSFTLLSDSQTLKCFFRALSLKTSWYVSSSVFEESSDRIMLYYSRWRGSSLLLG
jgi:hypothetical protein